jgi:MYXO-CTERM domain-containing protein
MRRVALLVASGCGVACAPPEASDGAPDDRAAPITNGMLDVGDPAVVAILDAAGAPACTGSLIGPHTLLTAGHCIPAAGRRSLRAFFGDSVDGGGVSIAVSDTRAHPDFDPATLANDLAAFTLREPGPAPALALDPRALDASLVGATFRIVGFGRSAPDADDAGDKRTGTAQITEVGPIEVTAAGAPSLACQTDSGGPALRDDGGEDKVFGVVSRGDPACADHAVFARVDVAAEAFVEPYLADTAPGTAATGDACFYEGHCAEGTCREAADDPLLYFCTRPCCGDGDCPEEMTCASGECRHPVPSPGALGSACAGDGECTSDLCYLPDGGGEGTCTRSCLGAPDSCPAGFACVAVSTLVDYCLPSASGCGCAGAPEPGGAWAPLAVMLALARRRARRHRGKPGSLASGSSSPSRSPRATNMCDSASTGGSACSQASRWRAR